GGVGLRAGDAPPDPPGARGPPPPAAPASPAAGTTRSRTARSGFARAPDPRGTRRDFGPTSGAPRLPRRALASARRTPPTPAHVRTRRAWIHPGAKVRESSPPL